MDRPFRGAIFFALASAVLHLFAFIPGGFASAAFMMIPFGIVYFLIAAGLGRGWRWFGYIAFLIFAIGGVVAMGFVWADHPVPGWWFLLIMAADWLAAGALFLALWQDPVREAET